MADDSSDIFTEVKEGFKNLIFDRFSSPLISSIALSWALLNYQFFVILFCGSVVERKIQLLNNYFTQHYLYYIWILPVIYGFLYTFAYPFFHRRVLQFVLKRKQIELSDRQIIEQNARYTHEDMQSLIQRHKKEIEDFKNETNSLKIELEELRNIESSPKNAPFEHMAKHLSGLQAEIVLALGATQNSGNLEGLTEQEISEITGRSIMFTADALGDLIESNVIIPKRSGDRMAYNLTSTGIKMYILFDQQKF